MSFLLFLAILAVVIVFVSRPLWNPASPATADEQESLPATELADLEAAREAKYREIREAELDHHTGKLSTEDFELVDSSLRAEAVEILRALDRERELLGVEPAGEDPSERAGSASAG